MRPITDPTETGTTLVNYRDAIRSIFDQTIEGMNRGLTPDELLFPLSPREEAGRIAALAGGADALLQQARTAFDDSRNGRRSCATT